MPEAKLDRHIYTVTQITQEIKLILENTFGEIWVEGEVSNFGSKDGHFYFTLKDNIAILPAVMFARANREIKFKIENGLKVICFGKISAYGPHGKYQIIAEKIEPKGIGSLQLALEQLKQKLEKEGLFRQEHKRPIPYLPSKIGVVTSLSGAAIRDILKVLDRRFSGTDIVIRPAQVQGDAAKDEIACAIKDLNRFNEGLPREEQIEVMIVGRGGGSIEDLWAFNEEVVARAIYNSEIPIVSAVGHERDWTVADLVADLRAATPSVAAELVIPKKEDLRGSLSGLSEDLQLSMHNLLKLSASGLDALRKKLALLNPAVLLEQHKTKIHDLARQAYIRMLHFTQLRKLEFNTAAQKLSSLSPLNILGRGYSITFKMPQAIIVKDTKFIQAGDTLKTKLAEGEVFSKVMEVTRDG